MTESILVQKPYFQYYMIMVNWKPYYIDHIWIYDDNKIICDLEYFQDGRIFKFNGETKLRRKKDLNKKENFIIKSPYISTVKNPYYIYIYYKNIDFKYLGTEIVNNYRYNSKDVFLSTKYKKYKLGNYVHYQYFRTLSHRKTRLEYRVTEMINKQLLDVGDYRHKPQKELMRILRKIAKLNARILFENEKLILREKLNK